MARDNPDTGWWCGWPVMTAPGAMTGGRVWAEPAPVAPVPQAGADISSRQRYWHSGRLKNSSAGKWKTGGTDCPGSGREARKAGEPADRVKEVIGDVIRGLERDRPGTEKRRYRMILSSGAEAAIQQVASERLQRERLQAVERDMVRDLNRENTRGD